MSRILILATALLPILSAQRSTPPTSYKDLKFPPLRKIEIPNRSTNCR